MSRIEEEYSGVIKEKLQKIEAGPAFQVCGHFVGDPLAPAPFCR
jgi:hypothetical protein